MTIRTSTAIAVTASVFLGAGIAPALAQQPVAGAKPVVIAAPAPSVVPVIAGPVAAPVAAAPATMMVGLPAASVSVAPILRQGTEVRFETKDALSSSTSKEGDRFELKSVEDFKVGQLLVIPAGSRAVGEVSRVVKKGAFGKSGKLDVRILYVVVGDNRISMTGKANDSGTAGTGGVVAAAILFWPVMPFITGTSANLPAGTKFSGYVENDIPLVAGTAPAPAPLLAPMVVPVASVPVAPPSAATTPATVQAATPVTPPAKPVALPAASVKTQ